MHTARPTGSPAGHAYQALTTQDSDSDVGQAEHVAARQQPFHSTLLGEVGRTTPAVISMIAAGLFGSVTTFLVNNSYSDNTGLWLRLSLFPLGAIAGRAARVGMHKSENHGRARHIHETRHTAPPADHTYQALATTDSDADQAEHVADEQQPHQRAPLVHRDEQVAYRIRDVVDVGRHAGSPRNLQK